MGTLFGDLDVTGALARRYGERAHEQLATDGPLTAAKQAWSEYIRACHGELFDELSLADGPVPEADTSEQVFVQSCYVDFLLDSLLDALEARTGVTLTNRDPRIDTVPVALGPLHDRILPPEQGRELVRSAVDESELRRLGPDRLRDLYRRVMAPEVRLALGEYYTPRGLAELAVAELQVGDPDRTVLDPGCGSGVFLTSCLDRKLDRLAHRPAPQVVETVTDTVFGIDLNPVAVKSAKLAYCVALFDHLQGVEEISVPIFLTDALGVLRDDDPVEAVDTLVGNPPWVPWERLPDPVKDGLRQRYVDELGLLPHEGAAARLGHSNDDLSIPFVWVCIHRYLRAGGQATFVLKRDITRGAAGAVLRRLQVGDRSLSVAHVHDFAALEPFPDVGANAAVYRFSADTGSTFPIDATIWERADDPDYDTVESLRETTQTRQTALRPIDPQDTTTAWIRADADRAALGDCAHEIRHGLKDDATDVFGIDRARVGEIEPDRVYPYLKSRHIRKYGLTGHDLRLVPADQAGENNEDRLRATCPDTYDYLLDHRDQLLDRSSSWLDDGPFYSVFGLGEYTWADYKLVWCRLGFKPEFAVVSTREDPDLGQRQVVPGDHYMFIATDHQETAHFLCALLNAAPYQRTLRDIAAEGKASLSKSVVSELQLPPWPDTDTSRRLAALSMQAHELVRTRDDPARLEPIQREIDELVATALAEGWFEQ